MIRLIKRKTFKIRSKLFARATLVEGHLKGTNTLFRCLFVDNTNFIDFMMKRMYESPPTVLRNHHILIPTLKQKILKNTGAFDLCIAVLPKFYESKFQALYDYKSTEWVRQIISTSGSWQDVRSKFSKTKRRISNAFEKKFGLEYHISSDLEDFDYFYNRMFIPHTNKRFKDLSEIDSYNNMRSFFKKGKLLLITKDNEIIAGSLFLVNNEKLTFHRTGVLDGNDKHIKGGAQLALYYFLIKYAIDQKFHAVDTMMSSSILNDGVYKNKKQWGASVFPDERSANWIFYFNARPSEKIAQFFEKNPMVVYSSQGLKGVIGDSNSENNSSEYINELTSRYQANGLERFNIVTSTNIIESKVS